jgi:hypothetical protein
VPCLLPDTPPLCDVKPVDPLHAAAVPAALPGAPSDPPGLAQDASGPLVAEVASLQAQVEELRMALAREEQRHSREIASLVEVCVTGFALVSVSDNTFPRKNL